MVDLLTDGRRAKPAEHRQQLAVELSWMVPKARCQFSLLGEHLNLPTDMAREERHRHWKGLTPLRPRALGLA